MPVDLPTLPRGATVSPRLVSFGGPLTPVLGGPVQRIARLGDRFAVEVEMPPLHADCAARLIAARLRAKTLNDTLRMPVPQAGNGAAVGAPIASAGAVNSASLTLPGAAGVVTVGMFFSFSVGGRSYLHMVTSVAGSVVGVAPLLRASPAGQALNFAAPVIEGDADGAAWSVQLGRFTSQRFTITEAR